MADMEVLSADMKVAGTMMHGCIKVDNNDAGANVGTHESHGVGDRCGRGVVRTWGCMEMGKSVSSTRCNNSVEP